MTKSRQLVAIMFTDIVDFTSMMHQNEANALMLRARFKKIIEQSNQKHGGHMLQFFGDGTLSLFNNAVDSVQCAIAIQKELLKEPEVPVRIGLHLGDVIISKDEILGDSVNIASRIESFSMSGAVFISDSLYDHVRNQHDLVWKRMGTFQLKNVERPYSIYALDIPGVTVPDSKYLLGKGIKVAEFKRSFPTPTHPILGRDDDISKVLELLKEARILTITGTGGIGKTRLSLEICEKLQGEYNKGISWISMSTITHEEEVMPTLASHLGIHEAKGRSPVQAVADTVGEAKALLVLDNLEHVIAAAREVAELSAICPNLKIICTSRTALKVRNEREYNLSPLTVPDKVDSAEYYSSVVLFVDRAQEANPTFKLDNDNRGAVVEICRRLDGLPLAIELAAARIRMMNPAQIRERLNRSLDLLGSGMRDLPDRHRTLRSTINWSYELLSDAEKELFIKLSIFSGGFVLDAVEKICYPEGEDSFDAVLHLESLVDKGLVSEDNKRQRFFLLQTIRDFARELMEKSDNLDWLWERYAGWYLEYSVYIMEGSYGKDQLTRLQEGAREEANIYSTLDYLLEKSKKGDIEARENGLSICGNLWMYWHIKGKNISTNDFVNSFLNSSEDMSATLPRCAALMGSVAAYWITGDFEKSLERAQLQHAMAVELGDQESLVKSLLMLTLSTLLLDIDKAAQYAEQATKEARTYQDPYWLSTVLYFYGLTYFIKGDIDEAERCLLEGIEIGQNVGDNESMGGLLSGLALVHITRGNHTEGMDFYAKSLEAFEITGDRAEVARVLSEMSWTYINAGDKEKAREFTVQSVRVYQEVGSTRGVGVSLLGLAAVEALEGNARAALTISAAADHFAEQEGIVNDYGYSSQDRSLIEKMMEMVDEAEREAIKSSAEKLSVLEVLNLAEKQSVLQLDH